MAENSSRFNELLHEGRHVLELARSANSFVLREAYPKWEKNVCDWLSAVRGTQTAAAWSSIVIVSFGGSRTHDSYARAVQVNVSQRLVWLSQITFPKKPAAQSKVLKVDGLEPPMSPAAANRVFIVHGHDDGTKETVARYVEKLGLEAIILHEKPNQGKTLIEKFEANADVGFAVVLFTRDDIGYSQRDNPTQPRPRARQNVVLELGYFIAKLGRSRVCPLYESGVELPSDFQGIVYVPLESDWRTDLKRELIAAGMAVKNDV